MPPLGPQPLYLRRHPSSPPRTPFPIVALLANRRRGGWVACAVTVPLIYTSRWSVPGTGYRTPDFLFFIWDRDDVICSGCHGSTKGSRRTRRPVLTLRTMSHTRPCPGHSCRRCLLPGPQRPSPFRPGTAPRPAPTVPSQARKRVLGAPRSPLTATLTLTTETGERRASRRRRGGVGVEG